MSYILDNKLIGKVALVTGASRGIGKGIAEVLVKAGATVYITGRIKSKGSGSVEDVAEELNNLNRGRCHHIFCDHNDDSSVEEVFNLIDQKCSGQLDILVNNAFSGVDALATCHKNPFWKNGYKLWDDINNVGLRSNYVCAVLASRMMVKRRQGLIINISSFGGLAPLFGVAYGVGKEGNDRMAMEMHIQLRDYNVTTISLWPGLVRTEAMSLVMQKNPQGRLSKVWSMSEHTTLSGKAITALASDPNVAQFGGKIVIVADLAHLYGFNDVDGKYPTSMRSLKYALNAYSPTLGWLTPHFLKIPGWMLTAYYHKF